MRDDTKNCCVADYTTISQTQQQRAQRPVNRSRDHRSQDLPGALECTEQVCSRTAPHANFEPTNLPPHKQRKNTSLSPSRREKTPEKTTCFPTFFFLVFFVPYFLFFSVVFCFLKKTHKVIATQAYRTVQNLLLNFSNETQA